MEGIDCFVIDKLLNLIYTSDIAIVGISEVEDFHVVKVDTVIYLLWAKWVCRLVIVTIS
jgi:hypothetical protein